MSELKEKMVPLSEAENEVKVVTQRLALLHLAYAKILVKEFGWRKGKLLVLKAIKEYGTRVAERKKRGYQNLPKYGFWERREGKPDLCELGKIVLKFLPTYEIITTRIHIGKVGIKALGIWQFSLVVPLFGNAADKYYERQQYTKKYESTLHLPTSWNDPINNPLGSQWLI